ncbi:angiopoietin-related protein 4 [Drosophila busckii]|uniref:angiopoietin-related protein 4 n=1 Tax=Drosophila busckii TaxID=30019 RepID=UPI001432826D|nr:angiopoietin-related protein 4 [Drosophila busckii]
METLKLQATIHEQQLVINKFEYKELLTNHTAVKDQCQAKFEQRELNTNDRAEVTSVPYGNDIQTIHVAGTEPFQVPFVPKFSGWVVIQRRVDDSVSFNRTWEEYKNGFGDLSGNFWLGLEKLHLMTKFQPHALYLQLEDSKTKNDCTL